MTPLFPLNALVFPGGLLPLRIFEPRYLDMVGRCPREQGSFVVVAISDGAETGTGVVHFYDVGTEVHVIDFDPTPDGLLGITVEGKQRVRIKDTLIQEDNLIVGDIERIEDEEEAAMPDDFDDLVQLLRTVLQEVGAPFNWYEPRYDLAGWVGARLTELLPLETAEKQQLMMIGDPLSRLFMLRDFMQGMELEIE